MNTFTKKGYGRIYVSEMGNIPRIKEIIKDMDDFEYTYIPWDHLFADPSEYPKVIYIHKFSDLDIDELTYRCFLERIFIFCFDAGYNEYGKPTKY